MYKAQGRVYKAQGRVYTGTGAGALQPQNQTCHSHARHWPEGLRPAEPCTGCNRFVLSSGCGWGGYYRVAHSARLMPNETRIPCRALVACLPQTLCALLDARSLRKGLLSRC